MMEIEGRRLQRHWITTPLTMTLVLLAAFYLIACWLIMAGAPRYAPVSFGSAIIQAGWWPLGLAAYFGVCGLLWGRRHTARARDAMDSAFGVETLDDGHWIAKRVHDYARQLDLPPPAVGVMATANAYAVGASIDDAAVVIGRPLIETLDSDELDAVIGHELGHIATGDMRRMQMAEGYQAMFVAFAQGMISFMASRLSSRLGRMLGRIVALLGRRSLFLGTELIVKRLSRQREYHADAVGALLTSREAMIGALRKLHAVPAQKGAEAEYAHLMLRGSPGSLFATHPGLDQRVAALESGAYITALLARAARVTAGQGATAEEAAGAPMADVAIGPPAEEAAAPGPVFAAPAAMEHPAASRIVREWELRRDAAATSAALVARAAGLLFDGLMALWPLSLLAAAAVGFFTTLRWLS